MDTSAKAGNWDTALSTSKQILDASPNYRDVKAKRADYLEQVYAAASTALSSDNPKEAVKLFSLLVASEPNYKDSNEKLGEARVAAIPKPGTVLYQADWSSGRAGWSGSNDWKVVNGLLINDGSFGNGNAYSRVLAPFQSPVADYAVEAEIQVVTQGNSRGIITRDDGTNRYYAGSDRGNYVAMHDGSNNIGTTAYRTDGGWHTYRLEAKGNSLKLYVDGSLMIEGTDNRFLSGARMGLYDGGGGQMNVRSFKVVAL